MFYLGIDVSKGKLDCCLLKEESPEKRKSKAVGNSANGFADLLRWLEKQGAQPGHTHVLLEATGVYHEAAATALHDGGLLVSILNPSQVRDFGKGLGLRTKTDGMDSWLLARFGLLQRPGAWQPPPGSCEAVASAAEPPPGAHGGFAARAQPAGEGTGHRDA